MKHPFERTVIRCLLAACLAPGLAPSATAGEQDGESPEAIVHALYDVISADAGATRDWNRYRALFLDGARLSVAMDSKVASGILGMSPEDLIAQTESTYAATGFHEIPLVTRVEQHGLLASVMSSFEIRLRRSDEKPLMRGLNHFQLLNDGERWWIVSNVGVIETASAPLPKALQPADGQGK
ncbi:hypothetical protein [Montanilutibacter psychrotolerans]|uniref:Nuclear transport factor 2 family protein n=1 Tax=Montanilutibacter psychrotolerans TaxID=1327343 RepID=A0A3M8SXW8_9GAMM|nr:hypothetical protein [Lysobacter psychrotolerans]RNF86228.1 hypothetical protein EER27_02055 [Lysobacter psychrotolerans]